MYFVDLFYADFTHTRLLRITTILDLRLSLLQKKPITFYITASSLNQIIIQHIIKKELGHFLTLVFRMLFSSCWPVAFRSRKRDLVTRIGPLGDISPALHPSFASKASL
jgi:hypothetical protein